MTLITHLFDHTYKMICSIQMMKNVLSLRGKNVFLLIFCFFGQKKKNKNIFKKCTFQDYDITFQDWCLLKLKYLTFMYPT